MAKLTALRADTKKEIDGVWFEYENGIEIKVCRWGNKNFQQYMRDAAKARIGKAKMTDEEIMQLNKEACAHTILVDWRGLDDDITAQPQQYSSAAALEYLEDPELHDFYNFVIVCANDIAKFRKEQIEAQAKN